MIERGGDLRLDLRRCSEKGTQKIFVGDEVGGGDEGSRGLSGAATCCDGNGSLITWTGGGRRQNLGLGQLLEESRSFFPVRLLR